MKKFLLITTILFCLLIGGCSGKKEEIAEADEITIHFEQLAYKEFIDNLPLLPKNDLQLLNEYRKEVLRRIAAEDSFLSEQESEILKEHEYFGSGRFWERVENPGTLGMNMQSWYAPILYKDNNDDIILLVTDAENGMVSWRDIDDLHYDPSSWIGNIHKDEKELGKKYGIARNSLVEYDPENQKINIWTYGLLEKTFYLPENSKYVGEGGIGEFYFRENSQVYRFFYEKEEWTYSHLADGVKEVVVTNYYFDYKHDCQPLFLMEDGTLKVYIEIEGVETNSKECLQPILNEGGYKD